MNTVDLCPRGRELYAEWMAWKKRIHKVPIALIQTAYAYKAYRQHVDEECDICKQKEE